MARNYLLEMYKKVRTYKFFLNRFKLIDSVWAACFIGSHLGNRQYCALHENSSGDGGLPFTLATVDLVNNDVIKTVVCVIGGNFLSDHIALSIQSLNT